MDEGERKGLARSGEFQPRGSTDGQGGSRVVYPSGIMWHMAYQWDAVFEAIRVERARRKWSQAELARRAGPGVSQGTVKNLEGARVYQRPPIGALQAIDRAFEWPVGTLEAKLGTAGTEDGDEAEWRRDPIPEGDLVGLIHHIVYEAVVTTAPDTPLSRVREIEAKALEGASQFGFKPPRRRPTPLDAEDPEP